MVYHLVVTCVCKNIRDLAMEHREMSQTEFFKEFLQQSIVGLQKFCEDFRFEALFNGLQVPSLDDLPDGTLFDPEPGHILVLVPPSLTGDFEEQYLIDSYDPYGSERYHIH